MIPVACFGISAVAMTVLRFRHCPCPIVRVSQALKQRVAIFSSSAVHMNTASFCSSRRHWNFKNNNNKWIKLLLPETKVTKTRIILSSEITTTKYGQNT